jgi:hypothetical protein
MDVLDGVFELIAVFSRAGALTMCCVFAALPGTSAFGTGLAAAR